MPFVSAPKKQNIPSHHLSHNAPTEKLNISLSVALDEQQMVLSAPTCVIQCTPLPSHHTAGMQPYAICQQWFSHIMTESSSLTKWRYEKMWPIARNNLNIYSTCTCNWCKTCSSNIKQQSLSRLVRINRFVKRTYSKVIKCSQQPTDSDSEAILDCRGSCKTCATPATTIAGFSSNATRNSCQAL